MCALLGWQTGEPQRSRSFVEQGIEKDSEVMAGLRMKTAGPLVCPPWWEMIWGRVWW